VTFSEHAELDRVIEAALRNEPLRPLPLDFHRRVTDRVYVRAMIQSERRRFRRVLVMAGVTVMAMVACGMLFVLIADIPGLVRNGVAGGTGYVDYLATSSALFLSGTGTFLAFLITPAVALIAFLSLVHGRFTGTQRRSA